MMKRLLTVIGLIGALAVPAGVWAAGEYGKDKGYEKHTTGGKAAYGMYSLSADQIQGMSLKSRDGKDVGSIHKVYINTETGKIDYAVVSAGGVLGLGDRKYVVPWQALDVRKSGERWEGFVASFDAEKLKTAPEYRADMTDEYRYSIWNWWGIKGYEKGDYERKG
ncbi:MAG: PRC-barrel domain-containing protein [Deltaproteobacteria bacterium]|nr:PRC-barrel domain-containing protein [Deltaproteobacteria bacterium]